jgi:hypothetical protein
VDALSDLMPGSSPFHYCFNNPLILRDPSGLVPGGANPVEFKNQPTIDEVGGEEASPLQPGDPRTEAARRRDATVTRMGQNWMNGQGAARLGSPSGEGAWDLNRDGKLQKTEADNWWLNGRGKTVDVNNAYIDWTGVKIPEGAAKGTMFAISTTGAFLRLPYETAATYGGTSFAVVDATHVRVLDQAYHYNTRPNTSIENVVRNILTAIGKPTGAGRDFMIHYYNPIILIK